MSVTCRPGLFVGRSPTSVQSSPVYGLAVCRPSVPGRAVYITTSLSVKGTTFVDNETAELMSKIEVRRIHKRRGPQATGDVAFEPNVILGDPLDRVHGLEPNQGV